MGLFDFILKKSSKVGGTARWVADAYKEVQRNNPQLSHLEILDLVNLARCTGYKDNIIISYLTGWVRGKQSSGRGLFNYTIQVLWCEYGQPTLPAECEGVVKEELVKAGIALDIITRSPDFEVEN